MAIYRLNFFMEFSGAVKAFQNKQENTLYFWNEGQKSPEL